MTRRHRGAATIVATLAALALAAAGQVNPAAAADLSIGDPVLDLGFEGSITDASPLGHPTEFTGHLGTGTPKYEFVDGVAAGTKALKLGGDTYVDLGQSTALQPSDLTSSFWINPTSAMSGEEVITWNKQAYNSDGWYLSSESNGVPLALSVGPASGQPYKVRVAATDRAAFFPVGEWTHIVVTYDSSDKAVRFYRNGVQVPSVVANAIGGTATGVLGSSESLPKTIGFNGPQYNGAYLRSALDSYRLYDGVATLTDVAALYEESGRVLDKQALAQAAAGSLSVPGSLTADVQLPTTASNGSTVEWESSDPDVISPVGQVTRPAEGADDAHVVLTAEVRYAGGEPVSRTFDVVVLAESAVLDDSGLAGVALEDDYLRNGMEKEQEYLLELSPERFMYWFYRTANLTPPTTSGYPGWENGSTQWNFRGHAFGHYMSALAMSYASSDDEETRSALLAKLTTAIEGLDEVQSSYDGTALEGYLAPFRETALDAVEGIGTSDDQVIVPYYNLHKVLAGLVDTHKYVPGEIGDAALRLAEGFGEYLHGRMAALPNKQTMRGTEFGGMNDVMYDLYVASGGNAHFKVVAEAFDDTALYQSLANGQDVLPGRHANTTIPKLIGALKRYTTFTENPELFATLTQAEKDQLPMYFNAAANFWEIVEHDHTYVTGANSQSEHFRTPNTLWQYATQQGEVGNAQTAETCNEYNMLKLSRELFRRTQDVKYADFYENAFINTILSSQNPETGMTTYFQAMAPGYNKVFGMPFTEFWCCIGTGMENFSKLGDSIYFRNGSSVYVNMFLSSSYDLESANLRVTQVSELPNEDTVRITAESIDGGPVADTAELRLRIPDWAAGDPTLVVNGEATTAEVRRDYVVVPVDDGDVVEYTIPQEVRVVATPDNPDFVALKYGPVVLSAGLGTKDITQTGSVGVGVRISRLDPEAQQIITVQGTTADWLADVATNVERMEDSDDGRVQFRLNDTTDGEDLVFTPHYLRYAERYAMYFTVEIADSPAAQARVLEAKQELRDEALVIDRLTTFDNNNAEASKNMKSSNSTVGTFNGRQYRDARGPSGWFSYDLEVDPDAGANFIRPVYYSGDAGRSFDVYVNDEKLKTETISNAAGTAVFYEQIDQIPAKWLQLDGNQRYKVDASGAFVLDEDGQKIPVVTVRFQSTGGFAGGIFGISTTRTEAWDHDPALAGLSFDAGELAPAFAPGTKSYRLNVADDATRVGLDADPHLPSGLVYVNDVLIDDTLLRNIPLVADGGPTVVTIRSVAQDHETSTTYTVEIVRGSEPALDVSVVATPRCVAGKVNLAVQATNYEVIPVSITMRTAYGEKSFASVGAGRNAFNGFTTRAIGIEAGIVTVEASATIDGESVTTTVEAAYGALYCGAPGLVP